MAYLLFALAIVLWALFILWLTHLFCKEETTPQTHDTDDHHLPIIEDMSEKDFQDFFDNY